MKQPVQLYQLGTGLGRMYAIKLCGICPGCLQQGKKIQSTQLSVERKNNLKLVFESTCAPGTLVDCQFMNLQQC
jgi:hypothetical protein